MQKTSQSSIEYRLTLVSSWAWTFFHCNLCGYSGDHDLMIPFLGTQASIRSLNFPKVEDWTAWHFNGQAAGLSHLTPFFLPTLTYDVYEGFRSPAEYTNVCQIKIVLQSNRLEFALWEGHHLHSFSLILLFRFTITYANNMSIAHPRSCVRSGNQT